MIVFIIIYVWVNFSRKSRSSYKFVCFFGALVFPLLMVGGARGLRGCRTRGVTSIPEGSRTLVGTERTGVLGGEWIDKEVGVSVVVRPLRHVTRVLVPSVVYTGGDPLFFTQSDYMR